MRWGAVIVAAGRGTRFGRPKQLLEVAGRPMLLWSVATFAAMPEIEQRVVVTEAQWIETVRAAVREVDPRASVVAGGATRQQSCYEGLKSLDPSLDAVLIHDGARPLITSELVRAGMTVVRPGDAALLAVPVIDTIKVARDGIVTTTLDRSALWSAQTPQFAMLADMREAHDAGAAQALEATDDAMLLEAAGIRVHVVQGSEENFKVTLPHDLERADHVLRYRGQCA